MGNAYENIAKRLSVVSTTTTTAVAAVEEKTCAIFFLFALSGLETY